MLSPLGSEALLSEFMPIGRQRSSDSSVLTGATVTDPGANGIQDVHAHQHDGLRYGVGLGVESGAGRAKWQTFD
jgi:hypothetical protein